MQRKNQCTKHKLYHNIKVINWTKSNTIKVIIYNISINTNFLTLINVTIKNKNKNIPENRS